MDRLTLARKLRNLGLGTAQIYRFMEISRRTYWRIFQKQWKTTRDRNFRKIFLEQRRWLAETAKARVVVTQNELARDFKQLFGRTISQQYFSRVLKEQGVKHKKVTIVSAEAADQPERHLEFHSKVAQVEEHNLIALDSAVLVCSRT